MPNGSGGSYPGVDPDGKQPGGLEIAGAVDAASFSVHGQDVPPFGLAPRTTLRATPVQQVMAGATPATVFDAVLYDASGSADLANNGISITKSGLYICSFTTLPNFGTAATGDFHLFPNCVGSGGPPVVIDLILPFGVNKNITLMVVMYIVVPAPDTFVMFIENDCDQEVDIGPTQMTLIGLT